jgi:hypothetical protein
MEMNFAPSSKCYSHGPDKKLPELPVIVVSAAQVKPPKRSKGVILDLQGFRKNGMAWALQHISSHAPLEPIRVLRTNENPFSYSVYDGYHRYYASMAAGFSSMPVMDVTDYVVL